MTDRYEKLDYADRWQLDGMALAKPAGHIILIDVDMTATQEIMARLRHMGIKCTYTHMVIRATALAFQRHPELNRLFLRNRFIYLDSVDIGLAVKSPLSTLADPTMVLHNVEKKSLVDVVQEVIKRAPEVRAAHHTDRERIRKVAHIIPSWARRILFRIMMSRVSFVKQEIGTFYITSVPHLHAAIPLVYPCSGTIVIHGVEDRVVVKDGQPVVRPILTLSNVGDRHLWQGNSAGLFLNEIKKILEKGELAEEIAAIEATLQTHPVKA